MMKIRIVSSKEDINDLTRSDQTVHLAYRASSTDMFRLLQSSPRLRAVQVPPSYYKNMPNTARAFRETQGVEIIEGDVWGQRKDIDEYYVSHDEMIERTIQRCVSLGVNTVESSANERIVSILSRVRGRNAEPIRFVGSTRIDETSPMKSHQEKLGFLIERRADICVIHAQLVERRREQVVGEGTLGRHPLQPHRDRARLPGTDPDRQVALPPDLLEDHHVLAVEHVDANALDHHLDQARIGHASILPGGPNAPGESAHRPQGGATAYLATARTALEATGADAPAGVYDVRK